MRWIPEKEIPNNNLEQTDVDRTIDVSGRNAAVPCSLPRGCPAASSSKACASAPLDSGAGRDKKQDRT